jgi:hypothetical protein
VFSAAAQSVHHVLILAAGGGFNPNPEPTAPPGLASVASGWIGEVKWIAIVAGILGLMACGIGMMIGRRNRSHLAGESIAGIPWVFAGLSTVVLAAGIVTAIIQ